ncbi:AglZ/HisF2 family acetamidino modification protein [Pedobacter sp.]|uniref:AglZ/HisF2 family acetamidino modification protein n=1 Tax=Pedobacter sp. TaxID=1411316 RepID=UPI003BAB66EB
MLRTRIIPCLQLIDESLVKTVKFGNQGYIGDPINTVRIFNELEVDELCFLDIRATIEGREPNFKILKEIADECFMPLAYGGGISKAAVAQQILAMGFEKVVLNTAAYSDKDLVKKIAEHSGNQSVIGSIDVKKNFWGKYQVFINDGTKKVDIDVVAWAQELEALGAGELLITSMDKDGTWSGYDNDLIKLVSGSVRVPVIANGGAGNVSHIGEVVKNAGASAVAVGSMVVYQKKDMGVLVNFPDKQSILNVL